jgi:hypothetical protein
VVRVGFDAADPYTPDAHFRIEQPAQVKGVGKYHVNAKFKLERDLYVVPLSKQITWIELTAKP